MPKILVVEDEASILKGLKDNLEGEGYSVLTASKGKDGMEKAIKEDIDMVLLDVMLPDMSGFDICKEVKLKKIALPIIMLTARSKEADKILGLALGADDYITKPFSVNELLARIKAVLRRVKVHRQAKQKKIPSFEFGDVRLDFEKFEAFKGKKKIKFSKREFEVLEYMIKRKGEIITRNDLLDVVWGYNVFPTTRTVDNFVSRIRKKIEDKPSVPRYILSVRSAGYRFVT